MDIYRNAKRSGIQLFRERMSEKVHATTPIGIVGGFEFTRGYGRLFASAKESKQKVGSTAAVLGTVYCSYPILPFGIVACAFLPTTFLKIAVYLALFTDPEGGWLFQYFPN